MLKLTAATVLLLATMVGAMAEEKKSLLDLHSYSCAWFMSDLETADNALVAIEETKRVTTIAAVALGFFQARLDAVSKAEVGKEPFLSREAFLNLRRGISEVCKDQPNSLMIDVIRNVATKITL